MIAPRPRRSVLFMPASNPRAIAKARSLACDAVILDLEDAVAPEMKPRARDAATAAVREGGFGDRELIVRVNAPGTAWGDDDLRALAGAPPAGLLLPKVEDAATIAAARAILGEGPAIWAMIETPRAVLDLAAIVGEGAPHGLAVLVAGTNDLALGLRCRPGVDRAPLVPALAQIVLAARAHGLAALDGVINDIDDAAAIRAECEQGARLGFDGKTLIHPAQIEPANRAFSPDAATLAWAQAVVAAFGDAAHDDLGAIRVDGQMVERLHLAEAERLLALAR